MASRCLGGIVAAIVGEQPFEKRKFSERRRRTFTKKVDVEFPGCEPELIPAIVGEITVERPAAEGRPRVSTVVTLLGCDRSFDLHYAKAALPKRLQLSQRVVDLLELKVGDPIVLRMNEQSIVPADTPLGRREGSSRSRRLNLTAILPSGSVGDFSLSSTEPPAGVALVSLAIAEQLLGWPEKQNAVFLTGGGCQQGLVDILQQCLKPSLADIGLSLTRYEDGTWIGLTSRRLVLEEAVDNAAQQVMTDLGGVPSLVFLANEIYTESESAKASVPYSTVLGIQSPSHPVGDLVDEDGTLLPMPIGDEVIINRWLADDLARAGKSSFCGG